MSNAATQSVSCCATVQSSTWRHRGHASGRDPFSIYTTSAPDQIQYLFSNAENTIVVTEKVFLPAVKAAGADLAHVIVVDADAEGCLTLE